MIVDGGANFTALVRLTTKRGEVLARPGESCAKVPASSLGWLERAGKIRRGAAVDFGTGVPAELRNAEDVSSSKPPEQAEAEQTPDEPRRRFRRAR